MKDSRAYKEKLFKNYYSTHNAHLYGHLSLLQLKKRFPAWHYHYVPHLPKDRHAKILEVGCGDGSFVYFLNHLGYENVVGIDLSHEQILYGRNLGINNLFVENVSDYLDGIEKYDLVIARDVIEHFDRQDAFDLLAKISGALSPAGRFIMQVPNGEGIFFSSIFFGDYTHEMAFTHASVRQLFLNTGFSEVSCYPTGPVPASFLGKLRFVLWNVRVLVHRFWKMVEMGQANGIFTSNLIAVGVKG